MLIRALLAVQSPSLRRRIERLLKGEDLLFFSEGGGDLCERLTRESYDLVMTSEGAVSAPADEGIAAIRALPDPPEIIVLVESEDPVRRASFQAVGAFATVNTRITDDDLRRSLTGLLKRLRESALATLRNEEARPRGITLREMKTKSPAMRQLIDLAGRLVRTESSLLITGETGVGKEWLARAIHAEGPRADSPFIAVNCAAIPDSLLESELFGHEKGSFTGAIRARRGFFELAHRGTLFLDEISEMPVHLQAKLLRVLQDRKVQRIGSERLVEIDVRIVAATNQDLEHTMSAGSFRKDLYYRLGVVTLNVPPLRERREDIPQVAREYLERLRFLTGHHLLGFSSDALDAMVRYDWPGNVRELLNVIERAVLLSSSLEITTNDLPAAFTRRPEPRLPPEGTSPPSDSSLLDVPLHEAVRRIQDDFEKDYLSNLLRETYGSVTGTARRAGIDTRTLYNKMRKFGLKKEDFRSA